ncbi:MAG: universal stress protein [Lutibacter sp.]|nr:universal stress protein [Lutibacter sp.]
MKTILYTTDYSENSVAALKYAHGMCLKLKAKLLAIHVFNNPTILRSKIEQPFPNLDKDAFREHTAKLEEFCKKHLGSDLKKMNIEVEAIQNKSAVDGIVSKSEKIQSLLIVTGMKGESKLRKLIMGSTARGLIEKAAYPVLTIPEDTSYNPIKTIIYATDFQVEDLDAIRMLATIAKPLKAKIKIVHISPLEKPIDKGEKIVLEKRVNKHVDYANIELDILYSDDIFNELKICFNKTNADIIAMLERESHSLTSELFYLNLLKKMKSYGKIPLMSFNAKNYGMFHL